ncbi:MAG: hypothetical protein P8Y71_21345 [Pseudolabrys sp.]
MGSHGPSDCNFVNGRAAISLLPSPLVGDPPAGPHWYENRGLVADGVAGGVLAQTVAALIAPDRMVSL